MDLGFGLYQQQTQKLLMTPELRQAITILQYSSIELAEYLHQEIVNNPVLEIDEREFDKYDFYNNNYSKGKVKGYSNTEEEFNIWDIIPTPQATLEEYLLSQARFLKLDKDRQSIINFLIGSINDEGYLTISIDEVAEKFNKQIKEIEDLLFLIHSFDPIGVGARNLRESLLIQLLNIKPKDELAINIVDKYLKELGERKFNKISSKLNVTNQEIQQVFDLIKTLKPYPALGFTISNPRYIIPDVIIEKLQKEYRILVNDSYLPKLDVNKNYYKYIKEHENDQTTKYINDKINSAKWLVKSLEQRKTTLYRVTEAIFNYQKNFLENQVLKPLTLKDVAEEIGIHESTVSRAINQKYVQTPLGIYELKYFFTTGLDTNTGESTSTENIKKLISDIILAEDKKKPLSDNKITELLKNKGIKISRRTVTKYREELGILKSSSRKRYD